MKKTKTRTYQEEYSIAQDFLLNWTPIKFEVKDANSLPPKWKFSNLENLDVNGRTRYWGTGFDGERLFTISGVKGDGYKARISDSRVVPVGGKTIQEQALQDAKHKASDKVRKDGYKSPYDSSVVKIFKSDIVTNKLPMLAEDYSVGSIKLWPLAAEVKVDGVRGLVSIKDGEIVVRSRYNVKYSFLQHLYPYWKEILNELPPGSELDGELYNHGMIFNKITGIVKSTISKDAETELIQHYVFDFMPPDSHSKLSYLDRYNMLSAIKTFATNIVGNEPVKLIPYTLVNSDQEVEDMHNSLVSLGFEGLVIRDLSAPYINRRSKSLLRFKKFITKEVTIVAIESGEGNMENCAVFKVKDEKGNIFSANMAATLEEKKIWFQNQQELIGKLLTIKYFGESEYGVPRQPIGLAIKSSGGSGSDIIEGVGFRDYE